MIERDDGSTLQMEQAEARVEGGGVTEAASRRIENRFGEVAPPALVATELCAWLRGLDSFSRWQHHPRPQDQIVDLFARDWTIELRIVREALTRARHLALSLRRPPAADISLDALGASDADGDADGGAIIRDDVIDELNVLLVDAEALCDGLLAAARVEFRVWHGFGRTISRLLNDTTVQLEQALHDRPDARRAHPILRRLAGGVKSNALGADLIYVFERLTEMLDVLAFVTPLLQADRPLKQTLPLLILIHDDAKRFIAFIEKRALRTGQLEGQLEDRIEGEVFDTLDAVAYALGMELRKVFAHELGDVAGSRHAGLIYSKIETAHGLLRDAFQQSVVTLAQSLDPTVSDVDLFDVVRTKLATSIALRADVWALLSEIRGVEREADPPPGALSEVLAHCRSFRDGSMRFLMHKDWEAFELFSEELARARGLADALPVLHRFATYLDTLFGQINMRAVFKDHPFEALSETSAASTFG